MKRIYLLVIISMTMTGCAATLDPIKADFEKVDFANGIDENEALAIAKHDFRIKDNMGNYDIASVKMRTDFDFLPNHSEFWFISFDKKSGSIFNEYLVIINKETGKIKFSDIYFPEKEWKLESIFFRQEFK